MATTAIRQRVAFTRRCASGKVARRLALMVVTLQGGAEVSAATWDLTPMVEVGQAYTDNVTLAVSGEEEDEYITQVNPGLELIGQSARNDLYLNYRMQNLYYANDQDRNNTFHQALLESRSDLAGDVLHLDLRGSHAQEVISPEAPVALNNLAAVANRTNVGTISASPYTTFSLGRRLQSEIRYRYAITDYDEDETAGLDNTNQYLLVTMGTRPDSGRLGWTLSADREEVDYDPEGETVFARVNLDTSYELRAGTALLAGVGYEDNDYDLPVDRDSPEGEIWYVGLRWSPSPLTLVSLRYGERFFGPWYSAEVTWARRRTAFALRYLEDLVSYSQVQLLRSPLSAPDVDPIDLPIEGDIPFLTNEVFVRSRLEGVMNMEGRRTTLEWVLFGEEDEYQVDSTTASYYGSNLLIARALGVRTTATVSGGWTRREYRDRIREDDLWNAGLALEHLLTAVIQGRIEFRHTERTSNEPRAEYAENLVNLLFTARF